MFVSGCAVLSGKALVSRKKLSQDQRERPNQVSPRQAGKEGRERERERARYEVREERGIETGRKKERVGQVSPRQPERRKR